MILRKKGYFLFHYDVQNARMILWRWKFLFDVDTYK